MHIPAIQKKLYISAYTDKYMDTYIDRCPSAGRVKH